MPRMKHPEPLVTKAVVMAQRQLDALEERASTEERSVSYFVREALDSYLENPATNPRPVEEAHVEALAATA